MSASKEPVTSEIGRRATSDEARERQLVALAYDVAEERLRNGTATSQEVTHFLKLGNEKARLERMLLMEQVKLANAKTKQIESQETSEKLFREAMEAMSLYQGKKHESAD